MALILSYPLVGACMALAVWLLRWRGKVPWRDALWTALLVGAAWPVLLAEGVDAHYRRLEKLR